MGLWEVLEYVGEALVFIGVVGEVFAGWTEPECKRLEKISSITLVIGLALSLAALIETNESFNRTIADLNVQAARSNQLAGAAQLDAANARKETAQLQKDTQGLKTDADTAKRDMVKAQLELARLTSPIQSVPVINGVATPDPTKGLRLRILLHSDVRIKLPTLPKGKSVTWTLFITQDEKGNRQFSTFPHDVMFGNFLVHPPHSFCTMDLVTDEYGTTDLTFGAASCPSNAIDPTSK
jgi:hypothetical protein